MGYKICCAFLFLVFNLDIVWGQMNDVSSWPLYQNAIPNAKGSIEEQTAFRGARGRFISYTSVPTLTPYLSNFPNGKAVIICPGGGYRGVAIDIEGHQIARTFQANGIHAFVLKYRTPDDRSCQDKSIAPLQDAQQALRLVSDSLENWGYQGSQVGIMGFSAGGHLAATASNAYGYNYVSNQAEGARKPDFSVLCYPVITMQDPHTHKGSRTNLLGENPTQEAMDLYSADQRVSADSPPVFLVHASDDQAVPVQNSLQYYLKCVESGVPAEMHIYKEGGHGFGLYLEHPEEHWFDRLLHWLDTL